MSRVKGERGMDALSEVDAAYEAGPKAEWVTAAQARLRRTLAAEGPQVFYDYLPHSPVGRVGVAANERGVIALDIGLGERDFVDQLKRRTRSGVRRSADHVGTAIRQLEEYLSGARTSFDLPIDLSLTSAFQRQVLLAALAIPRGETRTYHQVARRIGRPTAARAVGQALGHNPLPIIIPCHRVLGSDGSLHGYSGGRGLATKAWLLRLEGARSPQLLNGISE
jgi:methylated-DNA-[protein]-cysteine S-methyltransferase